MSDWLLQQQKERFGGTAASGRLSQTASVIAEQRREAPRCETIFILAVQQCLGKAWQGRERAEVFHIGELGRQLDHHLLNQEVAEGNSSQAVQAVIDGIKDGGVHFVGRQHRSVYVKQPFQIAG